MIRFFQTLVATLTLTSTLLSAQESVRFATEPTYPPFVNMQPDGTISGFETDLLRAICKIQAWDCLFLNQPFDSLIPGLKIGRFEGVYGGVEATPIRSQQVLFSNATYTAHFALLIKAGSALQTFDAPSLAHQTIGVQQGTTFVQFMRTRYRDEAQMKAYPSVQEALMELSSDRLTGVLADNAILKQWVASNPKIAYRLVSLSEQDQNFFGSGYAVAFRKDDSKLREQFNAGLKTIQENGTYTQIMKNYPQLQDH